MNKIESVLKLNRLIFDKIEFSRKGFRNEKKIKFQFGTALRVAENENIVTLRLSGDKPEEYSFFIELSGYFVFDAKDDIDNEKKELLLTKNAVAILMPYLRSQVSLLTAQPETESVVLPPFNINKMIENSSKK